MRLRFFLSTVSHDILKDVSVFFCEGAEKRGENVGWLCLLLVIYILVVWTCSVAGSRSLFILFLA